MDNPTLFIGLVTHAGSRFNLDGGAQRTVDMVEQTATALAIQSITLISDRNDYSASKHPITRAELASSALLQAWLEFRWHCYLADADAHGYASIPRNVMMLAASALRRMHSYLGWNLFRPAARMPGTKQVIRLLNIDLSHLRVYHEAVVSNADAVLVLEDDAQIVDMPSFGQAIVRLLPLVEGAELRLVNLSESLSWAELGVTGIVGSPLPGVTHDAVQILSCSRPITNTVCANLYSRSFVEMLRDDIIDHGLSPIIPIDWRVNRMIMRAWKSGQLDDRTCVWVSPGIFVQGSMHSS